MDWLIVSVGLGSVALNVGLLAMNLKLYTEFFKERVKGEKWP